MNNYFFCSSCKTQEIVNTGVHTSEGHYICGKCCDVLLSQMDYEDKEEEKNETA